MADEQKLEIRIDSQESELIAEIESTLAQVNAKREPTTRDLLTVLTVAAATVKLITALLDLKKRLDKPNASKVSVLNADRDEVRLLEATESTLTSLIDAVE